MDQKRAIAALGALAQETRLDLFRLLVTCGPEGLPAGVIAERLGVLPSSLSFHLAQLAHAGLITQRRLSRQIIYSAEYGTMNELLAYLTENCCGRGAAVSAPICNPAVSCGTTKPDTTAARPNQEDGHGRDPDQRDGACSVRQHRYGNGYFRGLCTIGFILL